MVTRTYDSQSKVTTNFIDKDEYPFADRLHEIHFMFMFYKVANFCIMLYFHRSKSKPYNISWLSPMDSASSRDSKSNL